jgi:hypothetical protein
MCVCKTHFSIIPHQHHVSQVVSFLHISSKSSTHFSFRIYRYIFRPFQTLWCDHAGNTWWPKKNLEVLVHVICLRPLLVPRGRARNSSLAYSRRKRSAHALPLIRQTTFRINGNLKAKLHSRQLNLKDSK